jgi:N6-L-threonylcarbamoyladenine synthase
VYSTEDVCASVTYTITESIKTKVAEAIKSTGYKKIVLAGGVSANSHIRKELTDLANKLGVEFYAPELALCGDNAAMIGAQGYYEYLNGARADESLNAYPS